VLHIRAAKTMHQRACVAEGIGMRTG